MATEQRMRRNSFHVIFASFSVECMNEWISFHRASHEFSSNCILLCMWSAYFTAYIFFSVKQKFYWTKNEGIIIFSWLEEASSWEIEPTSKRTNHFFLEYNFLLIWKWTLLQCAVCAFSSQRTQRNCIYSARSENFGNPFQHSLRFLKPQVILNCFYWSKLYENGRASLRTVFSSENLSSVWIVDAVEKYTNARTSNGYLPFFLQTMRACKHCLPQRAKYKIFRAYAAL